MRQIRRNSAYPCHFTRRKNTGQKERSFVEYLSFPFVEEGATMVARRIEMKKYQESVFEQPSNGRIIIRACPRTPLDCIFRERRSPRDKKINQHLYAYVYIQKHRESASLKFSEKNTVKLETFSRSSIFICTKH